MDDFRSLAKKFVPDNIADQFLPKPTIAILRGNSFHSRPKKTGVGLAMSQYDEHKNKHAKKNSKYKKSKTTFEIKLDELVAKVKESLQKDWSIFLTTNGAGTNTVKYNDDAYSNTDITSQNEAVTKFDFNTNGYSPFLKQVRYVKQTRDDTKDRHREKHRNVGQEKYVENSSVEENKGEVPLSKPSRYLDPDRNVVRFNKTGFKKPKRQPDPRDDDDYLFDTPEIKPTEDQQLTTVSEDPTDLLKETDIRKLRDSYEDYVTPKKDRPNDNYDELKHANKKTKDTRSSNNYLNKKNTNNFNHVDKANFKNKKETDDQNDREKTDSGLFEENNEIKSMNKIFSSTTDDDETFNYNKKNKIARKPKRTPKFFHTPDTNDDIFATTEAPTSQKESHQISDDLLHNHEPHNLKQTNTRYVPSRDDVENVQEQPYIGNGLDRLVEVHDGSKSEIVAAPSSMYLEQERPPPKNVIPSNKKQRISSHDIEKKRKSYKQKPNKKTLAETGTEDELHILKGFDLLRRDSYEDYVTPKKDDNVYDDDEHSKHELKDKASADFLRSLAANFERDHKNDVKVNDYGFDDIKKADTAIDDYETTNYNKKRKSTKNNEKETGHHRHPKHDVRKPKVASAILPLPTGPIFEKPVDYEDLLGEPRRYIDELLKLKKGKGSKMRPERFLLEEMMKGRRND